MNPLTAQLSHRAFPELAQALRSRIDAIAVEWDAVSREAIPQLDRLTFGELKDSIAKILAGIADALASPDAQQIRELVLQSPKQGLARFRQRYGVAVVMQEDRLLRAVIVTQVEGAIGRQMDVAEAAALHATVDVMLQQSVIALVEEQKTELRQSSERELKYLSFLSHDLNNHLSGVSLMLKLLRPEVEGMGGSSGAVTLIDNADQGIRDTVQGMRRLLEHERLRKGGADTDTQPMRLRGFPSSLAEQFAAEAKTKSLRLVIEADEGAVVNTDPELVSLVMRNLIGNAIKYTNGRTVRIGGEQRPFETRQQWVLWVADDGPGIAPEHLTRIFEAFQRGKVFGQEGVGLGLAIASQAARLLNAALRVESKVGEGSKFYLELRGRS